MTDSVIGALRVVAGFDAAYFQEALDKTVRDARTGAKRMQEEVDKGMRGMASGIRGHLEGAASQIPLLGDQVGALGGIFGAVAVGGLAAFAVGLARAREGMDWAATLTDQAAYIGVSTEALQEYRYMADEAGLSVEDMEAGLQSLNGALGAMKTGIGDAKLKKVFEALGITRSDLMPLKDASQLLPLLADKISQLGSQAEQAQIANKLGIGALLPLLQQGSAGMQQMAAEARSLGLVISNETVAALDDAQRKAEKASQVIDTQLRVAFANLAPMITGATQATADFTKWLAKAADDAATFLDKTSLLAGQRMEGLKKGLRGKELEEYAQSQSRAILALEATRRRQQAKNAYNEPVNTGQTNTPPVIASAMDKPGAAKAAQKAVEEYVAVLERLKTADEKAAEQYAKDSEILSKAYAKREITLKQYEDAMARLGGFEAADPFAKVTKAAQDIEPTLAEGIEVVANEYEQLAEVIGTDLAYAFGDAIARGEDLGDAFADVVRRMVATWASSGLLKLFGINEGGGLSGGGILGMFGLKNMGSKSILPGDSSQTGGWGGVKLPSITGLIGSIFKGLPGLAEGTLHSNGGLTWVGEEGPELLNLPRGGQVFPADVSRALMDGAGPVGNVSVGLEITPSPYFDARVTQVAQPLANQAALSGAQGGAQLAQIQTARSKRRKLR